MVVRTSNPLFLEVLTASPSLGVPIEFDVYDGTSPATMLATLENAYDRSFTQVLPDLGAGTFKISRHDPKNTPAIIRRGNIVKCRVAGIYRFAWVIDDIADVPLSPNEGTGEILQVSGRGVGSLLDRSIVYPPVFPPATIGMIGTSQATNAVTTSIAVTRPTGAKVGDLLLYGIAVTGGSSANITPPAGRGWVQVRKDLAGTSLALFVFRRRITATTNQTSDTFTIDTARQANAVAYCWRGVSINDLDMADAGQNNGSSVNITAPEVVPGLVNSVACAFFATAVNTSVTPPAGYAEQRDVNTTGVTIEGSTRALGSSLATTGPVVGVALSAAVNCGAQILMAPSAESAASYIGLTWGAILEDQLTEAQARGGLPTLTWDFSTTVDSMGAPWADTPQIVFPAGTPILDVYRQAIGMGLDAQVTTDLVVQVYEEYARHKETTVVFRGGYHLTDTVEKRLTEHGLKSRLLVEGAGGLFFEVADTVLESDPIIGRREGYLSFTTAVDPTTMQRGGEETLASLAQEAEALSIPVRHGTGSGQYEPFVDYRIGDWITLDVPGTYDLAAFRIAAITLQDAEGPDFDVTLDLNSVSLEYLTRLKRQLDQMGNPSSGSGTQSGSLASPAGGGAVASTGQVGTVIGDAPGYLFDKIAAGTGITKALVGVVPNQQLRISGSTPVLTLDGLTDVDTSTVAPTNGQVLTFDAASGLWKPGAGGGGGGTGRAIVGRISSTGTIVSGTGFTVTKGGTGLYTINYTTPFSGPPIVLVSESTDDSTFTVFGSIKAGGTDTASATQIYIREFGSVTAKDKAFHFVAIDPAGITAGGGGSSSVHPFALDRYALDPTFGDDFDGSSLNARWTRRGFTSGNETYQYGPVGTYMRVTMTGRTGGDAYFQTAPAGDWTFMMSGIGRVASWPYWCICAVDSSGNGIGTFAAASPSGIGLGTISAYTAYGGTFTLQSGTTFGTGAAQKYWQYLRKQGTTYYHAFSLDGELWGSEVSLTSGVTLNRIGMMIHPYPWSQGGGTTSSLEDIDVFNKIA